MAIQGVGNSQNFYIADNSTRKIVKSPPKSENVSIEKSTGEIETLKSKGLALAKSINRYDDEDTRLNLQRQLREIQNEIKLRDNDIYLRRNATTSLGVDEMA